MGILGLITTLTMAFGADRIQHLRYQSSKAQFVNTYEQLRSFALTSNYINGNRFDHMTIQLINGVNTLSYAYQYDENEAFQESYTTKIDGDIMLNHIVDLEDDNENTFDYAKISLKPYELGCEFEGISHTGGLLGFHLEINNKPKTYCFVIDSATCRLTEKSCKDFGELDFYNTNAYRYDEVEDEE